jgi:hypothetical protein
MIKIPKLTNTDHMEVKEIRTKIFNFNENAIVYSAHGMLKLNETE